MAKHEGLGAEPPERPARGADARAARRAEVAELASRYKSALLAHVQDRMAMVVAFLGIAGLALFVVSRLADLASHGFQLEHQRHPSVIAHLAGCLLAWPIYRLLRRRTLSARALLTMDVLIVVLLVGIALAIYAFSYVTGIRQLVPLVALMLIARAVAIPSPPWRTFWLSLLPAFGILAIQIGHGCVYTLDGALWPQAGFAAYVLWDFAILALAAVVAALTSRVVYALRLRAYAAASAERYTLEAPLGSGAMGEVYRGRHALLKRDVAVKILRPEIASEKNYLRFEKEVQRTSRLTHPNTVGVFDFGLTTEGSFYYVMELLDGADLDRIVQATGPLPPPRVVHLLRQACAALEEAHGQGLIHCDIKPANLMLCRRGGEYDVLKILDFGLAKNVAREDRDEEGVAYGTPLTMAPEVIRGKELTAATDLYSLGAVGYFLLTGEPVYPSETPMAMLAAHLQREPEPFADRGRTVSPCLEACILQCLAKDPAERPAGAAALGRALAACPGVAPWTPGEAEGWWHQHGAQL